MAGPGSPEELDVLLEDAYVTRDAVVAARLFETPRGSRRRAAGRSRARRDRSLAGSWWRAGNGGGIKDAHYGSGVSFRDPDNIALEFFAPPAG